MSGFEQGWWGGAKYLLVLLVLVVNREQAIVVQLFKVSLPWRCSSCCSFALSTLAWRNIHLILNTRTHIVKPPKHTNLQMILCNVDIK